MTGSRFASQDEWREGPSAELSLALPAGTDAIEIETVASGDVPNGSAVALLSPRVELEARQVRAADHPVVFDVEQRLTAIVEIDPERAEVDFGTRRRWVPEEQPAAEPVFLPPIEVVGSFTGRRGRLALALTGDRSVSVVVDLERDSSLRGALALDDRMPPGTRVRLRASIDDEAVATFDVDSVHWTDVDVPLGEWAGRDRTLTLATTTEALEPAPVAKAEPDFVIGDTVLFAYEAREARIGFASPRIATPASVPRRLATADTPSVLLLHVETLRTDALGQGRTPALDRLAGAGTVYETAIAPSPWTLPSTATLLTGRYPSAHGVLTHERAVVPDELPTSAELVRSAGVATGAVVTNDLLRADAGYGRGFSSYAYVPYANARQVNDLARAFVDNHVDQQFFLFLHYFDPHHPFNAPGDWRDRAVDAELRGRDLMGVTQAMADELRDGHRREPGDTDVRFLRQRYEAEIAWLDHHVDALLDGLDRHGVLDTTMVVFTADHGEEFYEHGLLGHGSNLFDETLRVPLIVAPAGSLSGWASGAEAGASSRVTTVTSTAGVFAEILDRMGADYERESVRPSLTQARGGLAFSETSKGFALDGLGDPLRRHLLSVRSDDHLLVWKRPVEGEEGDGEWELFDLRTDPGATTPRPAEGAAADELRRRLDQAVQWSLDHAARAPSAGGDLERLEALRALGYLGGPGAGDGGD